MAHHCYEHVAGILMCYDINDAASFESTMYWLKIALRWARRPPPPHHTPTLHEHHGEPCHGSAAATAQVDDAVKPPRHCMAFGATERCGAADADAFRCGVPCVMDRGNTKVAKVLVGLKADKDPSKREVIRSDARVCSGRLACASAASRACRARHFLNTVGRGSVGGRRMRQCLHVIHHPRPPV